MSEANKSLSNSDAMREHLSVLMDGELSSDETRFLLRRVEADSELAATWSRYQLVRSVLKRETFDLPDNAAFSAAVLAQLDTPNGGVRPTYRILRWAGGGAIAAAVAIVALTVSRPVGDNAVAPVQSILTASTSTAVQPTAVSVIPASDTLPKQLWLQQIMDPSRFDYAVPASFEKTPAPSYLRYPANAVWPASRFNAPYVLRAAPAPESQPASPSANQQQR